MSHTMNIAVEMHDKEIIFSTAERLGISCKEGEHRLFGGATFNGIGIFLKGWNYPAIIQEDGTIKYDNYQGRWGNIDRLNEFIAYYGLEKSKTEARKKGYSFIESINEETKELELTICLEG